MEICLGIQEYVEKQADKTPADPAVQYESKSLTYKELDNNANQVAHLLGQSGVGPNTFVGIYMERSVEVIVGILGVLKAGGAYVPIDLDFPEERLKFLIEDIGPVAVLTQSHLVSKLPQGKNIKYICLDEWKEDVSSQSQKRPPVKNQPEDIAYMIYTSGSTGKPKGCMNTHRGIANYLQWTKNKFPIGPGSKVLQKTTLSFDVSVAEIFWPLISGAALVMLKPDGHKESGVIVKAVREMGITDLRLVPSMLQLFLEEADVGECISLNRIIVSGEALPAPLVKQFYRRLPTAKLINLYGPTEAAVDCTFWECDPKEDLAIIPIGFPIPNNQIYVLDEKGGAVPQGEYGEIFIGGIQVSKGYWKRPDLTKERFVPNPFSKNPQEKMYKTGDRGKFLKSGAVEYQGRMDFQVKIRGFRIELGEIETVLLEHPSVKQAAAVAKKIRGDDNPAGIVAYIVPKGTDFSISSLRAFLKSKIPSYMLPAKFVKMNSLPVITSGKVDRKALMELQDINSEPKLVPSENPLEKMSATEEILATVWKQVLHTNNVGRDSNYFELGGDSLSLTELIRSLRQFGIALNFKNVYDHPSVAALAKLIDEQKTTSPDPLELPPLSAFSKTSTETSFPLGSAQNFRASMVFISALSGPLNVAALKRSVVKLLERQWSLRTVLTQQEGQPFQKIEQARLEDYFFELDFRKLSIEDRENEVEKRLLSYCVYKSKPTDKMVRFELIWAQDEVFYLCFVADHRVFDGVSYSILREELGEIYAAELENRKPKLRDLPIQMIDYALWERKTRDSKGAQKRLGRWREVLKKSQMLKLPHDFSNAEKRTSSPEWEEAVRT